MQPWPGGGSRHSPMVPLTWLERGWVLERSQDLSHVAALAGASAFCLDAGAPLLGPRM